MRRLLSPTTPNWQRHYALTPVRFRLIPFRSPLLRESLLLSFPRATEMFHFTLFPLPELCIHSGVTPHDRCRVSPFGRPRVKAWSAAHRGFSQPPASFIGSRRQGIRRWLFVAWNIYKRLAHRERCANCLEERCSCSLCNSQRTHRAGEIDTRVLAPRLARDSSTAAFPQNGREDGTASRLLCREKLERHPRTTK
jgi:hypothetical protein